MMPGKASLPLKATKKSNYGAGSLRKAEGNRTMCYPEKLEERCWDCDDPTGRAGRSDDSIYCVCELRAIL